MKRSLVCALVSMVVFIVPSIGWAGEFIDEGSLLGAGVVVSQSPYKGVDDDIYPAPVLILESKQFFIDNTVFGYYFNDAADPLRWAVIGSVRLQGYDDDDSSDLAGMQDRNMAFDSGVRVSWKNRIMEMVLEGVADVSGRHEGQEVRLGVSKEFFDGFLTPKAVIKWQSDDLVDYYYGVRPSEVAAGRPEYTADNELEYMLGVTVGVPLGEKWAVFGDVECSFLGDEVRGSPIVDRDALMRYVVGAVYRF